MTKAKDSQSKSVPFWQRKKLSEMSKKEWESLCDGCGRCCLIKFDDDRGGYEFTDVACKLLDLRNCRCKDYKNRQSLVPDCVVLTPWQVARMDYLPKTCGYRLVHEGKDLHWWHPLKSGTTKTVRTAGVSVRGHVVGEEGLSEEEIEDRIVDWDPPM